MISVILASHNGARTLPLTLAAMTKVRWPRDGVEFICVDNASTDETPDLFRDYADRLPLVFLQEPTKGKSYALNRGIEAANGDLLVFTDDDVLPREDWLRAYLEAATTHPEVGLFAGQVRHHWQRPPPAWLERLAREGRSYAGTPIERRTGPVPPQAFKGPNFMVRQSMLLDQRFSTEPHTNYGSTRGAAGGEDTRFVKELAGSGVETWYIQEAVVEHIVRPEQVGVWPVLKRYYRIGRSVVHETREPLPEGLPTVFGFPRYLIRSIVTRSFGAMGSYVSGKKYEAMSVLLSVATDAGIGIQTALRQSRKHSVREGDD